jgi:hypothetical protein
MKIRNNLRNINNIDKDELLKHYKNYLEEYFYVHDNFYGLDIDYFITNWYEWYTAKITNYLSTKNITWEYNDDMTFIVVRDSNGNIIFNKNAIENENVKPEFYSIMDYYEMLKDENKPNIIKHIFFETYYNFLNNENVEHPNINNFDIDFKENDIFFYKYAEQFVPIFENESGFEIENF